MSFPGKSFLNAEWHSKDPMSKNPNCRPVSSSLLAELKKTKSAKNFRKGMPDDTH